MSDMGFTSPPPPPPPQQPPSGGGDASVPADGGLPLEPRTPSKTISKAFETYREHWQQLLGLGAIYVLITFAVGLVVALGINAVSDSLAIGVIVGLLSFGLILVAAMVLTGAITRLVASDVAGQPIKISDSLSYGFKRFGPILLISFLVLLVFLGIEIVMVLLASLFAPVLWILLGIVVLLSVGVLLAMAVPSFVVEGIKGSSALSRSIALVKPHFWHALGTFALMYLIFFGASIVVGFIGSASSVLSSILSLLLQIVFVPFFSLVVVLLYVNLRVKSGGITAASLREELSRTA